MGKSLLDLTISVSITGMSVMEPQSGGGLLALEFEKEHPLIPSALVYLTMPWPDDPDQPNSFALDPSGKHALALRLLVRQFQLGTRRHVARCLWH